MDDIVDAKARGLFDQALLLCRSSDQLAEGPQVVDDLVAMIQRLRDAGACARYLQGGVLARLREDDRWRKKRGDLTFAEFCEEEVGLSYRTAKYLIDGYKKAAQLGLTPERLAKIGWTKAREFLPVANRRNVDIWIDTARVATRAELRQRVRVEKAKQSAQWNAGELPEPLVPWTVRVTEEQRQFIDLAVEHAAASDPDRIVSKGAALESICFYYVGNELPREKALDWMLAQIERVYGVRLAVVSRETDTG